jgi:hypothetical protein
VEFAENASAVDKKPIPVCSIREIGDNLGKELQG